MAVQTIILLVLVVALSLTMPAAGHNGHGAGFGKSGTWVKGTAEGREKAACKQARAKAKDDFPKLPGDHYLEFSDCACWHLSGGKTGCTVAFSVEEAKKRADGSRAAAAPPSAWTGTFP